MLSEKSTEGTDQAIISCQTTIKTHRRSSVLILFGILITLIGFFSYFLFNYTASITSFQKQYNEVLIDASREAADYRQLMQGIDSVSRQLPDTARRKLANLFAIPSYYNSKLLSADTPLATDKESGFINYGIYLFGIVVISILTALYRLHIKEVGKAEQNLIGFYRIRIAGNSDFDPATPQILDSLTVSAFYSNNYETNFLGKKKPMESPVPGHPGSDIVTVILNKLLENIEVKPKAS